MGWRYRKSVSFGPFRINASKAGLGWSFGLPGSGYRYVSSPSRRPAGPAPEATVAGSILSGVGLVGLGVVVSFMPYIGYLGYILIAIGALRLLGAWSSLAPSGTAQSVTAGPQINGPGLFSVDAVGESKYQAQLLRVAGGRTPQGASLDVIAALILEDSNPHDSNAVRVDIEGSPVGYLGRENARQYRRRLAEQNVRVISLTCAARIVGGWDRGPGKQGSFGVKLDLPT